MQTNDPRTIRAWCFFDWANSAYNLVITATIFPVYYANATKNAFGSDQVVFFGQTITNTVLYSYSISFSFLLIAFLSPVLSGMADYSSQKKLFMRIFTLLGSLACLTLFFFTGENVELGILAAVLASIGYSGALVFYNAFLPEIATPERYDSVSAKGFSYGYFGSVLLLIINLLMLTFPQTFGLESAGTAARISFVMVALWWIGFSQITFLVLKDRPVLHKSEGNMLGKGFEELAKVAKQLGKLPNTLRFLIAFFFFNAGVQTVIYVAAIFGEKELQMDGNKLIGTVLLLQIVAIFGAYLTAKISEWRGNKFALSILLVTWGLVCVASYFVQTEYQFYGIAAVVGFGMGGVQSLSRATYSKLLPENTKDTASFFSFYDIVEKLAIVLGTFLYGFIESLTSNMRLSSGSLAVYFLIGLVVLSWVRIKKV